MKYIWPLIVGIILIAVILGAWQQLGTYKLLFLIAVLIAMPVMEFLVQGKKGRLLSFVGLVVGLVCGVAFSYALGPTITEAIYGPISTEYNIRIDLVLWWALGGSVFASFFSLAGGWIGRRRYTGEY
jgi:hypothetical protein